MFAIDDALLLACTCGLSVHPVRAALPLDSGLYRVARPGAYPRDNLLARRLLPLRLRNCVLVERVVTRALVIFQGI